MKKTAVLLYNDCCLFEITVALEMLKMAEKPVVYFGKDLKPITSEEGMLIMADCTLDQLDIKEFDSLLITGCTNAKEAMEDGEILGFIDKFNSAGELIGAISIAPLLLLKLGYLKGKAFMIGVEKQDLYEEGFTDEDMKYMLGWRKCCDGAVPEKYLKTGNIITSVAFGFRQWAMAIGRELNIECYPKSFDLEV